jgi:hypothetical protein
LCGIEALSLSSVSERPNRFEVGHEDLQVNPKSDRSSSYQIADTIANDDIGSSVGSQNLQKCKICTMFAPHRLADEETQRTLTAGQGFIHTCQDNLYFLILFSYPKAKAALKRNIL